MAGKIFFIAIFLLFAVSSREVQASPNRALGSYFEKKIRIGENAMGAFNPAGQVNLVDYNLQFVAQAGFGLSNVVSLVLYPEIDLVFVPSEPADAPASAVR